MRTARKSPEAMASLRALGALTRDDLMRLGGVSARELKDMIEKGAVDPAIVPTSGATYSMWHVEQVRTIKALQRDGYTVGEAAELIAIGRNSMTASLDVPRRHSTPNHGVEFRVSSGIRVIVEGRLGALESRSLSAVLIAAKTEVRKLRSAVRKVNRLLKVQLGVSPPTSSTE